MKKALLKVGLAIASGTIFGQTTISKNVAPHGNKSIYPTTVGTTTSPNVERAVIWQNDFSSAGDWTMGNNAGNSDNWVVGTGIPSGSFPIAAIASTSAANGFALFDSDALCSGNQSAWIRNTTPIDLSAHPAVILEFQQFYRKFSDDVYVQVSNNGTTWTDYVVNSDLNSNQATTNPDTYTLNITAVAGGQATVYIRFFFVSDASNTGDGCDYAWMVDDVKISDAPDNDVVLNAVYYGEYSQYPVGQEVPIEFSGKVTNFGATAQTNVALGVSVNGTPVGAATSASLAVGATDSLVVGTQYTPSGVGTYNIVFAADQDQTDATPADNTLSRSIKVTNYTFARDNGNYTGAGLWNGSGNGYILSNLIAVNVDAQATSISVALQGNTDVGATFKVVLLDDLADVPAPIAESDFYAVTAADINGSSTTSPIFVTLPFIAPQDIAAGEYIVGVDFGGGSEELVLAAGTDILQPIQTSFVYDYTNTPAADWFYVTSTPMIRLNINEPDFSSVEENSNASVKVFPNPTTDFLNVTFGEINGDVVMTMFSTDGKQVMNQQANVVSGQNTMIDVANMSAGIYTLRVVSNNGTFSKKVVIK